MYFVFSTTLLFFAQATTAQDEPMPCRDARVERPFYLANVVPALDDPEEKMWFTNASSYIPVPDTPFIEHVREKVSAEEEVRVRPLLNSVPDRSGIPEDVKDVFCRVSHEGTTWIGTGEGLFRLETGSTHATRHP